MADSRFFKKAGPFSLQQIASLTGAVINGSGPRSFTDVAPLDGATASDVSFLDNVKYAGQFAASQAGACFVRPKFAARAPEGMALLVTENPYYCFALTAQAFYPEATEERAVSPHAQVAKSATLGKNVHIGAFTVIGEGVVIGDDSRIASHCSISHAIIGSRAIIHPGVHIGQDGFGFAPGPKGLVKVPQLGRVVIGDDVEIGSGTCIDRGAGPDTVIGDGVKIDNLVQIGHNVRIGKHAVIVAQVGISGSTHIGDGAMLAGQVGVAGHLQIGAGAKLAAQAGAITDLEAGGTYGGTPAVPVRDWHRQSHVLAKLIRKEKK